MRLHKLFNESNEVATYEEIMNEVCEGRFIKDGIYLLADNCLLEVLDGELELIDFKIAI